ncbi:Hypothetical protein A7982_02509 [Minicystis rosea]|nr:Hypothetical protein A7982_02509 [Minicystis rosea]
MHLGDRSRLGLALVAGVVIALVPAILLWGFTVDDALITARYATHLARGLGYRFNASGPVTDGVTPLGFPYLLAPFAANGPLAALFAAKRLGLVAWTAAAAVLVLAVDRAAPADVSPSRARYRFAALPILACSAPLAAWSVAGMETGLAAALAAFAVALPELGAVRVGALAAGLCAALRPETLPFAFVLSAIPTPRGERTTITRLALAVIPFAVVVAVRLAIFGRVVPLSVFAKPSDATLGAYYALACFMLTGPLAIVAPIGWLRASGWARGLVIAVLVHFLAVAAAGGDWMPLSRLVVPALPAVVLAFAHLAMHIDPRVTALRVVVALAGEIFQIVKVGPAAARVGAARLAVIDEMRAPLEGAKVVAALDIGWLGAATDATIVDLAGLTDPSIAVLPGGHTSKAIPATLLDARGTDALVLLVRDGHSLRTPWTDTFFSHVVELRIAAIPGMTDTFAPVATSHVPHLGYVVLRRTPPAP